MKIFLLLLLVICCPVYSSEVSLTPVISPIQTPSLTPALKTGRQLLPGHVIKELATAPLVGDVPVTMMLHIGIGLPMRNEEEYKKLFDSLYDPNSPIYRKFIGPEEYGEKFGASKEDYQAVIDFAQLHGLKVTNTFKNRLLVSAEGTVSDILSRPVGL
jgi:subtilase family serine protease